MLRGLILTTLFAGLLGCQGSISDKPPVHLQQNMDFQNRFEAQEETDLFEDRRAMRGRVEGTVAWGHLKADDHLYRGRVDGAPATDLPKADENGEALGLTEELLQRGRDRYAIFCTPCHDGAGTGDGLVVQRGFKKPPSLHEDRLKAKAVGDLYDVVANGFGDMPGYKGSLSVRDRWAVAAYVRALQVSRSASLNQVPPDKAAEKRWEVQ